MRAAADRFLALPLVAVFFSAAASACASEWKPAFDEKAKPGHLESVAIADPNEALTFARSETSDGTKHVIAVSAYRDGTVRGVDLSAALGRRVEDPIAALRELGYDGLLSAVREAIVTQATSTS